ncbi:glycosyltransferase family 4 protein [Aneurinibacillus sp. Ricciae_BoGa-3]|uniref:glycosyltransferase family 4 protein n=1 Tax=Aneurinibacillus sp. Ricciae_BoGa-3 TaxID=3022697 RepID=UPI0023419461|nr:glycosyltransferase family 4 protein [Aneurinibacillus sp. Ricciae_BoGa-3]WCK56387.1 glycosyltransferase family 4 protein [Aneurinibacillus sp. Ricciae_BoGa-3]
MMRCWVLTYEYNPFIIGGLGIVATHLTRSLARDGLDVTVISRSGKPHIQTNRKKHLNIVRFPATSKYYSVKDRTFCSHSIDDWLAKNSYEKPQILHIHSVHFAKTARYLKLKFNAPVVYTCHSLVRMEKLSKARSLVARQQEELLSFADAVVVPSLWLKSKTKELYPHLKDKLHVIENGVHVKRERCSGPRHHLLNVGRLVRSKGIEKLLGAVAILSKKHPKLKLDVVGTGSSAYRKHLRLLARTYQITERIRWLGFKTPKQVQQLYSSYGVVVVPSPNESFGLVALEALANNIPLVSTRSGGLAEFVNSSVAEIIHRVSPEEIAQAIENMWKQEELTNRRVAEGRKMALQYSWPNIAARYHSLFTSIL